MLAHNGWKNTTENLIDKLEKDLQQCNDEKSISHVYAKYLNKQGIIQTEYFSKIIDASEEEKKIIGNYANIFKKTAEDLIKTQQKKFEEENLRKLYESQKVDLTLKARYEWGSLHPITQLYFACINFFKQLNFQVVSGSEIDESKYNFELLNISDSHPSTSKHDTFYLNDKKLLRTHCTNITAKILEKSEKNSPLRVLSYGNVFRKDDDDATHSHEFSQLDVVLLDKNVSFANLKWLLEEFLSFIFKQSIKTRYRSSYFPFTEPSIEVDIECIHCQQKGCSICKKSGWIEILGAGLINPKVLSLTGHNPDLIQGLAFGIGIERLAMIKYKINDIRLFYENNLDFLRQFGELDVS